MEANEALSKKDFVMRIKISIKESDYWLRLLVDTNPDVFKEKGLSLINESIELKKIFSLIVAKL
jgi:hypothetical protein